MSGYVGAATRGSEPEKIVDVYTEDEIRRIIQCAPRTSAKDKRDYVIILLAASYGMRSGDITKLRLSHIDWDMNLIKVTQSKTGEYLELPLLASVGNAIIDYLQDGRPRNCGHEIIVVSHMHGTIGNPLRSPTIHSIVSSAMQNAKIENWKNKKHGAHSLRHSLATNLLKKNASMPVINTILGHRSTETTRVCKKYSEGCRNCYMYYLDKERGNDGSQIYKTKASFKLPLSRTREGDYKIPSGSQVHVCMTSDFFLEEADAWREEAWGIIAQRRDLRFWLQTKRAERVREQLPPQFEVFFPHVSMCFTAENQEMTEKRIPILLNLPFREKYIMCAPMLTEIDLEPYLKTGLIKGVLVDGENYEGMRPLHFEWVEKLYAQCLEYGVNFDFCGTGNVFIKDGKEYHIPKAYQRVEAIRSGLQLPPMEKDVPIQPKCRSCERRFSCNGCKWCGRCQGR